MAQHEAYVKVESNAVICRAKLGLGPNPAPKWVGNIIASILQKVGPTGLEFGRYSIGELQADKTATTGQYWRGVWVWHSALC